MLGWKRAVAVLAALTAVASAAAAPASERPALARQPYTVTDAAGRRVTFDMIPERIVLAGRAVFMVADALYAFPEAWSRLVATTEIDQGLGNFLAAIDPDYGRKVTLSGAAGAEEIAALKPGVVILKSFMAESVGRPLESLGIPVLYVDFESPEQYRRDLMVFGELLQSSARAEEIWAQIDRRVRRVTARTSAVSEQGKPRVLLVYDAARAAEHAFNVPPAGWIQTRLVEMAGGRPVWKEAGAGRGWNRVGFEQIAAWNPDWVFVVSYHQDVDRLVRGLRADAAWQRLAAVGNGRLAAFPVDFYSWDQPDLRWVLGLQWLASRLHPGLFMDMDLDRETIDFFSFLYGISEEDVRRAVLSNLRGGYR